MITQLAPKHWQAAVVDRLVHQHAIDREDARKLCWRQRFDLTRIHNDNRGAAHAAQWIADQFDDKPRVLNKRSDAEACATYIGRGSKWGNPFRTGPDGDRATVVEKHERWLRGQHQLLRALDELRGQNLMCYCAPLACHGDVLLKLANGSREDRVRWWRCEAA